MTVVIEQKNQIVEVIEEGKTIVEVVTQGPQGPPGEAMGYKSEEVDDDFVITDENEIFILAEGIEITFPDVATRNFPVVVHSEDFNASFTSVSPLPSSGITPGESFTLSPRSTGWKII